MVSEVMVGNGGEWRASGEWRVGRQRAVRSQTNMRLLATVSGNGCNGGGVWLDWGEGAFRHFTMPLSIRSFSKKTGFSPSTVSRALRGSAVVNAQTREKILRAARRHGYVSQPLVGAVMSSMRRSRQAAFVGNLALVYISNPRRPQMVPFQRDIISAATARARELGFSLMVFDLKQENLSVGALARMLRARGALGVIIVHTQLEHELDGFPWDEFSMVEIDHSHSEVTLNAVCIEHHRTFTQSLARLLEHGYRRSGLFISEHRDKRLDYVWSAAFLAFQETHPGVERVPVLRRQFIEEAPFLKWFDGYSPDILIGHRDEALDWLGGRGLRAPGDFGFFNLNWNERRHPCAGLNLCPELQGCAAVEVVVAQIHRQERGAPANPQTTMVSGRWVDGPTVAGKFQIENSKTNQ